jgi:autotransporter family porin
VWGCVGRWYAGNWHAAGANRYIASVKTYMTERIWEQPSFTARQSQP